MGLAQVVDQGANLDHLGGVQADGGLVQDNDLRLPQQRGGDAHPLAVAFGKVADQPPFHPLQAGAGGGDLHSVQAVRPALGSLQFRHKKQIFPHRHLLVKGRLLRQIPNARLGGLGFLRDIMPRHPHGPRRGGQVAGKNIHRGGLARAVGAEQAVNAAVLHGEADIVHRQMAAVTFCQMFDFDQGTSSSLYYQSRAL